MDGKNKKNHIIIRIKFVIFAHPVSQIIVAKVCSIDITNYKFEKHILYFAHEYCVKYPVCEHLEIIRQNFTRKVSSFISHPVIYIPTPSY